MHARSITTCTPRPRPRAAMEPLAHHARLEVLPVGHPERTSLQQFMAECYLRAYGARIQHFAQYLVGLRGPGAGWIAGVGFTPAGDDPLFLEQYLDRPAEVEVRTRTGVPARRGELVEVGNLSAAANGAARHLIMRMGILLYRLQRTWVVFTSTRGLVNSFLRLGIEPVFVARADPGRLPDNGASWGSYYDAGPCVMTANIPAGCRQLAAGGRALHSC